MTCEAVDGVFKCVEELENQGSLRLGAKNLIQTLKFELRFVRLHLKWHPYLDQNLLKDTQTWVKDVQQCLLQVTRQEGSVRVDFPEEKLSSLLVSVKKILCKQCSLYYEQGHGGLNINCKDVPIDVLLLECIDPLLENLKHLMLCNDLYMLVFPTEQIEVLIEKLKSLRNIVELTGNELKELEIKNVASSQDQLQDTSGDLLTRIIRLFESAVYASCYSWTEGKQKRMEKLFFDLRVEIDHIEPKIRMICVQLLRASKISNPSIFGVDIQALTAADSLLDNLQGLLNGQDTSSGMPLEAHQIELLYRELSFIKYFLMDPNLKQYTETTESQSFNPLIIQFEAMASKGASLICSNCIGQSKDHLSDEMNLLNSNLLKVVELIKAEIRKIYEGVLKPSVPGFPQTPMPGFLDFFLQRLDELLKHRADSIAYVKDLKILQMNLEFLSLFVSKAREEDADIVKRVLDVAHEAERVIDLIAASSVPRWHYMLWISDVIEKIIMLRKDCPEVCSKKSYGTYEFKVEKTSVRDSTQPYSLVVEEEVVGFEVEAKNTIDLLIKDSRPLDIVSIVGMPGLGKTTLAKKVYEDDKIRRHFHVRSWYCISQVYDKRDLLLSILGDVTQVTEKIRKMDDEDMAQALCKSLRGKKYLIVIDDIWSIEAWKDMQNSFPDDFNGSRILFTSRLRQVAVGVVPRSCDPVDLTLLSDDESWEFLRNKVFKHRTCPLKLHKIGKKIAKNCGGLPLSLVVIAGVLKRLEESEDQWEQVLVTLSKQVVGDSSKYTSVLELSYKHLPDHLKPCFLYLGAFPEDKEIQTWKLVRLWIAEGFVQKPHNQSLENVAEGYLVDLIRRSLVLISQSKSCGGVKSCRVHDLLREFCLNKAKVENFLLMSKEMMSPEQYRRCFPCKKDSLDGWMPHDPFVRSAIFFPTERPFTFFYDRYPIDPSVFPHIMKLLRVLDLERVPLKRSKFPTEIQVLVHLRYLAIQGRLMNRVPSSVGNLWRLETFVLKGTGGKVTLPEALLKMAYLKHVYVDGRITFELPPSYEPDNEESIEAASIEKLSTALFRHGDGTTEEIIRRLTSLQKLKCIFSESSDDQLHALDLLIKLECLNATCHGHLGIQFPFSFPTNLVKLALTNFRLPWSEISKIGELTQLTFLKLLSRAFEGERWDVSEEEFLSLKFLKLESLDIVEWEASPGAFPSLEQLVLQKCKRLKQVPPCFGELDTLKMIKVHSCSNSATKSVCEIREEQGDSGPDGLKVVVDWDSAPTS